LNPSCLLSRSGWGLLFGGWGGPTRTMNTFLGRYTTSTPYGFSFKKCS
jgi:hypothetical protein